MEDKGIPDPLAKAKSGIDDTQAEVIRLSDSNVFGLGGVHLENIGTLVQAIAYKASQKNMKGATIRLTADDYPDGYDHWSIEVKLEK